MTRIIEVIRRGRRGGDGVSGVVNVLHSDDNITLSAQNRGFAIIAAAEITITLPSASAVGSAWSCSILADGGAVTLSSTSNIAGSSSDLVIAEGHSVNILTDGDEFFVQYFIASSVATVNSNAVGNESGVDGTNLTQSLNNLDSAIGTLESRTVTGDGLATGGGDLSANRTITVTAASQAQAEAGADGGTAMTPLRTAQAFAAFRTASTFTSSDQTIATSALRTLTHGLGGVPAFVQYYLVCQTDEAGYSAGDIVAVSFNNGTTATNKFSTATVTATQILVRYADSVWCFSVGHKDTGNGTDLTNGNWRLRVVARR